MSPKLHSVPHETSSHPIDALVREANVRTLSGHERKRLRLYLQSIFAGAGNTLLSETMFERKEAIQKEYPSFLLERY